jgi:hypothetical protein
VYIAAQKTQRVNEKVSGREEIEMENKGRKLLNPALKPV